MAWTALKAAIDLVITTNGNNEITGAILNAVLDEMVDNLGLYQFAGVALPATVPGTPDGVAWYIAAEEGVYPNFGGAVLLAGQLGFFKWNGSAWVLEVLSGVLGETQYIKKYEGLTVEQICIAPEKSLLTHVIVVGKVGTTTISLGTTSGATDISRAKTISLDGELTITKSKLYKTAENIFINIAGGTVDVTLIFTTGILN